MSITFVMVEPARAANVGAAARAIKTMGFTQLVIVGSDAHKEDEARWVAHGAHDILDGIQCYPDVASLRNQFDLVIGTTARERGSARTYLSPSELSAQLEKQAGSISRIALLFGREASGLTNEELSLCDLYSYVPLVADYPSLNLGQAVMVYSYALSEVNRQIGLTPSEANARALAALRDKASNLMESVAEGDNKLKEWLIEGLNRLSDRDIRMAHQLFNDIQRKLD